MPYYVYRIETRGAVRKLDALGAFDDYRSASLECRRLRASQLPESASIRMIFADNALRAEELLGEVREPGPIVDEDF